MTNSNRFASLLSSVALTALEASGGMPDEGKVTGDLAHDNTTNRAPITVNYHPASMDLETTAKSVRSLFSEMERGARKQGSQLEQFVLLCADWLFFRVEMERASSITLKGMPMSLKDLEKEIRDLVRGLIKITPAGEKEGKPFPATIEVMKPAPVKAKAAKGSGSKGATNLIPELAPSILAEQRRIEAFESADPIGIKNLNQMLTPACKGAFLVLFGKESFPASDTGTTYRKVRRYLDKVKQPVVPSDKYNPGDMPEGLTEEKQAEWINAHTAENDTSENDNWPANTYEGIGLNDFVLHPSVVTGQKSDLNPEWELASKEANFDKNAETNPVKYLIAPEYTLKSKLQKYDGREIVGMTGDSVDLHYERFFGTDASVTFDIQTGLKVISSRVADTGTSDYPPLAEIGKDVTDPVAVKAIEELKSILRSERAEAENKPVTIKDATRSEFLAAAVSVIKGLPTKEDSLSEDERDYLMSIYSALDALPYVGGLGSDEDEGDMRQAMAG